jgi:NAD(P)-dependent dehydrogenase (short-subunit alcohol dehydrogenase family)
MGIDGFCEAVIPEVASFGIDVMLVEPGGARTDFASRSMSMSEARPRYADTPVGRSGLSRPTGPMAIGDPVKMARAIIESVDQPVAPKRLLLGSDAHAMGTAALHQRLDIDDDHYVLTNHLEGDFSGGQVDLKYRFALRDNLITTLEIAP